MPETSGGVDGLHLHARLQHMRGDYGPPDNTPSLSSAHPHKSEDYYYSPDDVATPDGPSPRGWGLHLHVA